MMKYALSLVLLTLFALPAFAAETALTGKEIVGVWWTPKKDARMEITESGGIYTGKLIWVLPEKVDGLDTKNPDPAKRTQKILGSTILNEFKFDDGKWRGTIYDPKSGKTYSCKMTLDGGNLRVRGYIGISLLGRTEIFTPYVPE